MVNFDATLGGLRESLANVVTDTTPPQRRIGPASTDVGSGAFASLSQRGAPMVRFLTCATFVVSASGAEACPSFGFQSTHLSEYFCRQIDEFAGPSTRNLRSTPDALEQGDLTQPDAEWLGIPEIERAWRSDPAKTLKLIDRIRDAGGRAVK